jgi:hypothetical protein
MQDERRRRARTEESEVKTLKKNWDAIKITVAICMVCVLALGVGIQIGPNIAPVLAQATGYRFAQNSLILTGLYGSTCHEPSYNAGVDGCIARIGAGQLGQDLGNPNAGWASIPQPPTLALATATTGGTIPDGTSYRLAITYLTQNGGETNVTSAVETTQTTSGGGLSTITATAPIASAGVAGYRVWSTNASGVGNSNATLTETLQPITTAVCAGAFNVDGPAGLGTGPVVCPIGTNAVLTSLTFTGSAIPTQNTAGYPAALPELIANLVQVPTLSTITTAQTFSTIPLRQNVQNFPGKVMRITGHGRYTSGAQTGTMTIAMTEGGITPVTVTSKALTTGGQTNQAFTFDFYITTNKTGATGTLWGHGTLCPNTATGTQTTDPLNCSADAISAVSSSINLTAQNNLALTIAMSSSTTSATLDDAQVWLLN